MKIKNFNDLACSEARSLILTLAETALAAIDTGETVRRAVTRNGAFLSLFGESIDLNAVGRVLLVGIGKCASAAAAAILPLIEDRLTAGIIIDVSAAFASSKIRSFQGTHPLPSEQNVVAAAEIVSLLKNLTENDLVIFIVSGGGSTLLCLPEDRGCEEEVAIVQNLLSSGATIQEINVVRKHLSLARGGHLARYAYPARIVALIFSDVPGNDLSSVASGPTVKDETTVKDAAAVLARYDVLKKCGLAKCGLIETPKEDKYFARVKNILAVSNQLALQAVSHEAEKRGLKPQIVSVNLTGEARLIGGQISKALRSVEAKTLLLYGGESTVAVRGVGRGGRNQELALAALRFVKENEVILALASDGRDNSDFAGAIADSFSRQHAAALNLDPEQFLAGNDAYTFFQKTGDYLLTGLTGSNVADLIFALRW